MEARISFTLPTLQTNCSARHLEALQNEHSKSYISWLGQLPEPQRALRTQRRIFQGAVSPSSWAKWFNVQECYPHTDNKASGMLYT